ncbi:MAG: hypothetical protein CMK09_18015 [Ponticaulis sp.]|nr:hypothetical protein [Ponticaulis sp.]|tara:strand:+ start:30268 stop:30612 length:345 start_codon:yes stop_codon:yes gene_type:complete
MTKDPIRRILLITLLSLFSACSQVRAEAVELPQPDALTQLQNNTINVTADGRYVFRNTDIPLSEILSALAQAAPPVDETRMVIRGDPDARFKDVMDLMELLQKNGYHRVALVVS